MGVEFCATIRKTVIGDGAAAEKARIPEKGGVV